MPKEKHGLRSYTVEQAGQGAEEQDCGNFSVKHFYEISLAFRVAEVVVTRFLSALAIRLFHFLPGS